ncbi:membrane bound O-acyl transferase MBOAT family protein, partial [human gut metagenome]
YTAASVTEFWRRWHISLTTWFREYLYIPLGGSRKGTWRTVRNIFLVWFCTGFWHGASWNFILWGLHFFVWLMLEKYLLRDFLQKLPSWLRHFYTLVVVFVGWGVFAMEDLAGCAGYFKTCFGSGTLWSAADGYYLTAYGLTLLHFNGWLHPSAPEGLGPAAGADERPAGAAADDGGSGDLHGLLGRRQLQPIFVFPILIFHFIQEGRGRMANKGRLTTGIFCLF